LPPNVRYTLYPPLNFEGIQIECNAYLYWQKPELPGGGTPAGLLGYYLYRDGVLRHYIPSGDSLTFYDYGIEYGTYLYTVTAYYDLSFYGVPGQFGESPPAGPVTIFLNCDVTMPFHEDWALGTFVFQNWQFIPAQGNWFIDITQGNPLPTAVFTGLPAVQDYESTLKSTSLPAEPWVCANMYFEFDYKLTDITASGTEKLVAEYYVDNTWFPAVEFTNEGSTGWIHQKIDISQVCDKRFRIGFKVSGSNSANIGNWSVDNIKISPKCFGPEGCDYLKTGNVVHLLWLPPACDSLQVLAGYNVYRSEGPAFNPYLKLNLQLIQGLDFFDTIPFGYPSGQFRYYITDLQKDLTGTPLCEASGDTLVVDLLQGIGMTVDQEMKVLPNPADNFFNIESDTPLESCELLNFFGQNIRSSLPGKQTEFIFQVSDLPSGIYLLRIKNASGTFVRKVVVVH